jgi:hypothetical protein
MTFCNSIPSTEYAPQNCNFNSRSYDELGMWSGQERQGMHTGVSEGNILENVHLEDQERYGNTSLLYMLERWITSLYSGWNWFRIILSSGGLSY